MAKFCKINGYWKDDNQEIKDLIVADIPYTQELTWRDKYTDDEIFFYSLDEKKLAELVELKEYSDYDFVVTSYEKIEKNN